MPKDGALCFREGVGLGCNFLGAFIVLIMYGMLVIVN